MLWRKTRAGGILRYVREDGALVEQIGKRTYTRDAKWKAIAADGEPLRHPMRDGSEYLSKPWHKLLVTEDRASLPPIRYFVDRRSAMRAIEERN